MAKKGRYRGHKETCLIVKKGVCSYPVTRNGSISCGRVRNAPARAKQQGKTSEIKRGGYCHFAKRCGVKSDLC